MLRKTVVAIVGRIVTAGVVAVLIGGAWWLWRRLRTGTAIDWDSPGTTAMLAGSVTVLLLALWWLWWRLPQRYVARLAIQIHDPKARADAEDNLRKTIGQALGGAAVLIGAGAAYLQFTQQQQASSAQLRAAHDLLISNQVARGFEQLAGDKIAMRLGGIYALEGVMNDPSQQYHQPVLDALCAFVRDGTRLATYTYAGATDIQAALAVIERRGDGPGRVDLRGARLDGADLNGANFSNFILSGAGMSGARLGGADLSGADLRDADLHNADLSGAHLTDSNLGRANLSHANLSGTELVDVDLEKADLRGADLRDANLRRARLSGADLRDAMVSQRQLVEACGTDAKPETALTPPVCSEPEELVP